jgi:hypothetical protein
MAVPVIVAAMNFPASDTNFDRLLLAERCSWRTEDAMRE